MSNRYGSIAIPPNAFPKISKNSRKPSLPRLRKNRRPKKSGSKAVFFVIAIILCLVSYFMLGTFLVPKAINRYLPAFIEEKTGLSTSMEEIRFNPFTFQVQLNKLQAVHPDSTEKQPLLEIESLFVDLDLTALIRNTLVCDKLTIQSLHLNIIRHRDNTYNFPALSRFTTQQEGGEIIAFSKLPFLFSLNNIKIENSSGLFTDRTTGTTHDIKQVRIAIPTLSNFSFQSKNYITPHFSAIIDGSPVELSGQAIQLAGNQGFQTKLSCSIQSLELAPYFSYLPATFPASLTRGQADLDLQITFLPNRKHGERLRIDIKIGASNLELKGKDGTLHLEIPAMKVDAVLNPMGKQLQVSSIIAKRPHLTWTQAQFNTILHDVPLSFHREKKFPLNIHIEQVLSDKGSLTLLDETKGEKERVSTAWHNIQLSISNLRSDAASAIVNISGEGSVRDSSFSWQSRFSDTGRLEGKILLDKLPASTLFKYLSPGADTRIQGIATFSADIHSPVNTATATSYSISNGIAEVQGFGITHKNDTWLQAESIRFTRLSRANGRYKLGNIFLHGAELTINPTALPPFFTQLFLADSRPLVRGIDYSGKIHLRESEKGKQLLTLSAVSFQANNLEQTAHSKNFAFSAQPGTEGEIKAQGTLALSPVRVQADMAFSDVHSKVLTLFTDRYPFLKTSSSMLHGKGTFRYPKATFQGDLRLTSTSLQSPGNTPLIQWDRADIQNALLNFSPFSMEAETLSLDAPVFEWIRDTRPPLKQLRSGIQTLLQNRQSAPPVLPVTIQKIRIQRGKLHITDKRINPAKKIQLDGINGYISQFSTMATAKSSFTLDAFLEGAPLRISGGTSLSNKEVCTHTQLTLTGFPLASLSGELGALPIKTKGATLDLHGNITEEQGAYSSTSSLLIHNLQAASSLQSDTATTLAFMKDSAGNLSMDIQLTDSGRALLPEAVTIFQKNTIKASYAPLLLDEQFKDLQNRNTILFPPGSEEIIPGNSAILGRYAELLTKHPGLGLGITGMTNTIDHDVILARLKNLEQERIDKENAIRFATFQEEEKAAWTESPGETLQEEDISSAELSGFKKLSPEAVEVPKNMLLTLANARGRLIFDTCIHEFAIPQNRMRLKTQDPDTNNAANSPINGVRITIFPLTAKQDEYSHE